MDYCKTLRYIYRTLSVASLLFLIGLDAQSPQGFEKKRTKLSLRKQASKNFVNFWSFKDLADFWFIPPIEPPKTFDPALPNPEEMIDPKRIPDAESFNFSKINPGDIIFVRNPAQFLKKIHPHIKVPYLIITHGHSPDGFKEEYLPFLEDPLIIAWFTIHAGNYAARSKKLFSIPLGIRQWPNFNRKPHFKKLNSLFLSLREQSAKQHLLYMNFVDWTDPERKKLKKQFSEKPFCFEANKVSSELFMQHMANCKFTLAPRGVAPSDTFRVWESLIVGSFPIMKRTAETDFSLYEGLPVLFVKSWNQVTPEFLEKKYKKLAARQYSLKKLYMDYWIKKILVIRRNFLQKNNYN